MFTKIQLFVFLLTLIAPCQAAFVDQNPMSSIEGKKSLLNRPESIAFSPCGNFVAIANSDSNNIIFYRTADCGLSSRKKMKDTNSSRHPVPVFILGAPRVSFGYPHDIAFSPDGSQFAVASRRSNCVTIHRRNINNGFYDQSPFAVIEGTNASLKGINGVKFKPCGNCLAVADVKGHQIALFRYSNEKYEELPYQRLTGPIDILDRPDGLAFSHDGQLLAVTSHGTHSVLIYEKTPNSLDQYRDQPAQIIHGQQSHFLFSHSVCFHPVDDTLVVSFAGGKKTLATFKKLSNTPPYFSSTPSQTLKIYNRKTIHLQKTAPEEGGVKGVAFSNDGRFLGICASDIANPAKTILFYQVEF